jgi:hypothetical protein
MTESGIVHITSYVGADNIAKTRYGRKVRVDRIAETRRLEIVLVDYCLAPRAQGEWTGARSLQCSGGSRSKSWRAAAAKCHSRLGGANGGAGRAAGAC